MSQQGQLWSATVQIGKETTSGTPVAATRKMYWRDPVLTATQDPRPKRFATGTRDNVRGYTNGPKQVAGSFTVPDERGRDDRAAPGDRAGLRDAYHAIGVHQRAPLDVQAEHDARLLDRRVGRRRSVWQGAGIRGNQLKIEGGAMDENVVSLDLFGTDLVAGSLTGSLTERVPTFLEGWQARLYIDTFGSAFGGTLMSQLLRNWSVTFNNQLGRVYTADNTLATNRITTGELEVNATLTFDAAAAQALTEFNNWQAGTKRGVRLEFVGPAADIEAGVSEVQTMTLTTPVGNLLPVFMGQTGAGVASPYTAAALQTSLRALSTVGSDGITVTGSNGGPFTMTFGGRWAEYNAPAITATLSTSGTAAVVETTPGRSGRRSVFIDIPGHGRRPTSRARTTASGRTRWSSRASMTRRSPR
jgi:hypothetical protein